MNASIGRTCLIGALLCLALAAALSVDLRHDGAMAHAQNAGMQLQGVADDDVNATAPDDEAEKPAPCEQRACTIAKPELAFVLSESRPVYEGKAFVAHGDEVPSKSKE